MGGLYEAVLTTGDSLNVIATVQLGSAYNFAALECWKPLREAPWPWQLGSCRMLVWDRVWRADPRELADAIATAPPLGNADAEALLLRILLSTPELGAVYLGRT